MINSEIIWKKITDFPDYEISNQGEVKNNKGKILKSRVDDLGYKSVNLYYAPYKHSLVRIHRLVAKSFIDNPNNYDVVNHLDCNRKNNCVSNLEWTNKSGNAIHAVGNGLWNAKKGSESGVSKLTEEQVKIIKKRLFQGESYIEISKDYSVHMTTIYSIWKGKSWSWLV